MSDVPAEIPGDFLHQLPQDIGTFFKDSQISAELLGKEGLTGKKVEPIIKKDRPPQEVTSTVKTLITIAGEAGDDFPQDYRDIATEAILGLLKQHSQTIDEGVIDVETIINTYAAAVRALPKEVDSYGAPFSLLELGEKIVKEGDLLGTTTDFHKAKRAQTAVEDAWEYYYQTHTDHDETWPVRTDQVATELLPLPRLDVDDNTFEFARQAPQFEELADRETHDTFLREVRLNKSFKGFMTQHATEYRKIAETAGIDIIRYWNINDPDQATSIMTVLSSQPQGVVEEFNKKFRDRTGLTVEDLRRDDFLLARSMIDELYEVVDLMHREKKGGVHDPDSLIDRFRGQVQTAQGAKSPDKILNPIKKMLTELGYPKGISNSELYNLFQDPAKAIILRQQFHDRNAERATVLEWTSAVLEKNTEYSSLRMAKRDEQDLYSGDKTRDCTAYHLDNGFNAWTVPYWLMDPGENMFYITDGSNMVAKVTTVLAVDDQGRPRLTVDSMEVNKGIRDEMQAITYINQGLAELQDWSKKMGIAGDIFFCTFTNSSGLIENLPVLENPNPPESLRLLGEYKGLKEVRDGLGAAYPGSITTDKVDSYLQSRYTDAIEEGHAEAGGVEQGDRELIPKFEKVVNAFIKKLDGDAKMRVYQAGQTGIPENFIHTLIREAAPAVHHTYGDFNLNRLVDLYKEGYNLGGVRIAHEREDRRSQRVLNREVKVDRIFNEEFDDMDAYTFNKGQETSLGTDITDHFPVRGLDYINPRTNDGRDDPEKKLALENEEARVGQVVDCIIELEDDHFPLNRVLTTIFGAHFQGESQVYTPFALNRKLEILKSSKEHKGEAA